MKIFLSWSRERSRLLAMALRDWLPLILHYVKPWLSEKDIAAGDRWSLEVGKGLEESNYGIICLTRENLDAPWILFEAGALSKVLATSAVCPYLLDVEFSDITGPLSQFQAKKAEKNPTFEMIQAINSKASESLDDSRLTELFDVLWPKLEQRLRQIPANQSTDRAVRTESEILEELVATVRGMDQRIRNMEIKLPTDSGQTARRSGLGDVRRSTVVRVRIEENIGKLKAGNNFKLHASQNLIEQIADFAALKPEDFGKDWYIVDRQSARSLSREECENVLAYFGDATPVVTLTEIPF